MGRLEVRAAIALASTSGEGRYPSGDVWCSEMSAERQPCCSPHAAISIAARYRSVMDDGSADGARMSNRSMYTTACWHWRAFEANALRRYGLRPGIARLETTTVRRAETEHVHARAHGAIGLPRPLANVDDSSSPPSGVGT